MGLKAIIFDVDGTLADTEEAHRQAFNRAFEEHGLAWHWDVPTYRDLLNTTGGRERITVFAQRNAPQFADTADLETRVAALHRSKTTHYLAQMQAGSVTLRPGIRRLIEQSPAAGIQLAIATTTTPANIEALLTANLGSDWRGYFAIIEDGHSAPVKKPDPSVYQQALSKLGYAAEECLAIEDSANGLKAALSAGIDTIITKNAYTSHHVFGGALAVYDDLSNVTVDTLINFKHTQEQPCHRSA